MTHGRFLLGFRAGPTEATPPSPTIPDYELLRLIGRGAYGEVWLARGVTGIYRAVKIVWRERFPEAGPYEREFHGLKEFAAISLSESRQLALLHVGRDPAAAYFYYVMELADDVTTGREIDPANYTPHTLKEARRHGRLPAGECLAIGIDLTRALAGLHARGLVHRDIKPSNIIFVGGAPKLADIGLVTAASEALTFVGTEGFVPPEGPGAPSADVFALGKLLYELVTGLDRHDYPRLPAEIHTWPDRKDALELNEVLIRACEPHPDQRHPDAAALLDDLLLLQAGKSVRRLRRAERRLSRAVRIAAVLALIAGIAGLGAYIERQRANEQMILRAKAEAERDALARQTIYSATLAQAQRAVNQDDLGRARRLLGEVLPKPGETDLRGFEWHALWNTAQGDPATVLRETGPAIDRLFLSPDETLLAVHDSDSVVTLYAADTQQVLRRIGGVGELAGFSSDGRWLVGADQTKASQRWSVDNGQPDGPPAPGKFRVLAATGTAQVVAHEEGQSALVVWDFAEQRVATRIELQAAGETTPWGIFRSMVGGRGEAVALASVRGAGSKAEFRLTAFAPRNTPQLVQTEIGPNRPSAVGVDSRGPWAVLDITGEMWRPEGDQWHKQEKEKLPQGTRRYVETIANGVSWRLAAQVRRLIWLDRTTPDDALRFARGHGALLSDVAVSPRHNLVFSAALDGGLRAWPLRESSRPNSFEAWNNNAGATGLVFSADSRRLCVPLDGKSSVWLDAATLQPTGNVTDMLYPVALTPNGLLGVATDAGLLLTDAGNGALRERQEKAPPSIRMAATTPDGERVAVVDQVGDLRAAGRIVRQGLQRNYVLLFDRAGRRLWTTATNHELLCLSWPDGRELWKQTLPAIAPDIQLQPDQELLVVALENGTLEVREAATGALVRMLDSGSAAPQALAFSPDGTRLFVGGLEGEIHCFAAADWHYLHALPLGAGQRIHSLTCSPDGRTLAALTKTGTLHVVRTN